MKSEPPGLSAQQAFSPKVQCLIRDLGQAAQSGNQEAIELLGNLAIGNPPLHQYAAAEVSVSATWALVSISRDPQTHDLARAAIRQFALQAFEITRPGRAGECTLFHTPVPLLALAQAEAQSRAPSLCQEIGQTLHDRLKSHWPDCQEQNLQQPTRFCSFEEIFHGAKGGPEGALPLKDMPLIDSDPGFGRQLLVLGAQALRERAPRACIVSQGGSHWVITVVGPSSEGEKKLDVVVYDSLHEATDSQSHALAEKIRRAFDGLMKKYTHAGGNVQGVTNGCGPMCVRALRELRTQPQHERGIWAMGDVAAFLKGDIEQARRWTWAQRDGVVTGWRAEMLGRLEALPPPSKAVSKVDSQGRKVRTVRRLLKMPVLPARKSALLGQGFTAAASPSTKLALMRPRKFVTFDPALGPAEE